MKLYVSLLTVVVLTLSACQSTVVFDASQRFYLDFAETCRNPDGSRGFWCEMFCPYFRHIYSQTLLDPALCMYGLANRLNCSEATEICSPGKSGQSWCSRLHDTFISDVYIVGKSEEFRSCFFLEEVNSPCAKDPECVKWCNALIDSRQKTPYYLKDCMETGAPPENCKDEEFCEDFCAVGREATLNTPEFVLRCAFLGKP